MKRHAQIIRLKPGARDEYMRYHRSAWHEVLKTIYHCNIRNYSIFLKDDTLYAYFEYLGNNFEADMAKMEEVFHVDSNVMASIDPARLSKKLGRCAPGLDYL